VLADNFAHGHTLITLRAGVAMKCVMKAEREGAAAIGLVAEMMMTDPDAGKTGNDGKLKRAYLRYPQYDLINSLSVHLADRNFLFL
jgi:hypothetical protein